MSAVLICFSNIPEVLTLSLSFRVVKEEISDDGAKLPCFNGRVVSWVRHNKRDMVFIISGVGVIEISLATITLNH